MLTKEQLLESHDHYMSLERHSLNDVCDRIKKNYNVSVKRHWLSKAFRENNLYVFPRNGFPVEHYVDRNKATSPEANLSSKIIELVWIDIFDYLHGKGSLINYASACWYLTSDSYQADLEIVGLGGEFNKLPKIGSSWANKRGYKVDIVPADIITGKEIYKEMLKYWIKDLIT